MVEPYKHRNINDNHGKNYVQDGRQRAFITNFIQVFTCKREIQDNFART